MSTKSLSSIVGLTVPGLFWLALRIAAAQAPAPLDADAPTFESPADQKTVILLSNGNLQYHDGPIHEEKDQYVLEHRSGTVRIPKTQVEEIFPSIQNVYEYKLRQLPRRDPDERMKLAQWCLSYKLVEEAIDQLQAVLELSPGDRRAEGMLSNLQASADRQRYRDDAIQRAGAVADVNSEPNDQSVIDWFRSYSGPVEQPKIFDLPDAQAFRRYEEFGRFVHPVLQHGCARCHDENSNRPFQLVRARNNKDLRNSLLIRTNLEATLGLVDRLRPNQSPLLINAAMPHGPEQRPALGGSNTQAYHVLENWVSQIRMQPTEPGLTPVPGNNLPGGGFETPPTPSTNYPGGFASQRSSRAAPSPAMSEAAPPPSVPYLAPGVPANVPGQDLQIRRGSRVHDSVPETADFQTISPLIGGPNATSNFAPMDRTVLPAYPQPQPPTHPVSPVQVPQPPTFQPPPQGQGQGQMQMPPLPGGVPKPSAGNPSAGNLPAGNPAAGKVQRLPDGSEIITQADGTQVLKLPDGTLAPIMDRRSVQQAPTRRPAQGEQSIEIDPSLLEQFQTQRMQTPPQ